MAVGNTVCQQYRKPTLKLSIRCWLDIRISQKRREALFSASLDFAWGRLINYRKSSQVYLDSARALLLRHILAAIHRHPMATSSP